MKMIRISDEHNEMLKKLAELNKRSMTKQMEMMIETEYKNIKGEMKMKIKSYYSNGKDNTPIILCYEVDENTDIHLDLITNECNYIKNGSVAGIAPIPSNIKININDYELHYGNIYRLKSNKW